MYSNKNEKEIATTKCTWKIEFKCQKRVSAKSNVITVLCMLNIGLHTPTRTHLHTCIDTYTCTQHSNGKQKVVKHWKHTGNPACWLHFYDPRATSAPRPATQRLQLWQQSYANNNNNNTTKNKIAVATPPLLLPPSVFRVLATSVNVYQSPAKC